MAPPVHAGVRLVDIDIVALPELDIDNAADREKAADPEIDGGQTCLLP